MTADECYQLINFVSSKNQGGYLKPSDFNNIMNRGQTELMSSLLGNTQNYGKHNRNGATYGMNEDLRQKLTPFIDAPKTLVIAPDGFSPYPSDFQQVDAMIYGTTQRVRFVAQDSLFSYINSDIDPVAESPIYVLESGGFRFTPNNLGSAVLYYISKPNDIIWAYTVDANGRNVYDAGNSQDPEWYDIDTMDVIGRALRFVGINLKDQMISQYATELKTIGQ